jgi:hypothetical protein
MLPCVTNGNIDRHDMRAAVNCSASTDGSTPPQPQVSPVTAAVQRAIEGERARRVPERFPPETARNVNRGDAILSNARSAA